MAGAGNRPQPCDSDPGASSADGDDGLVRSLKELAACRAVFGSSKSKQSDVKAAQADSLLALERAMEMIERCRSVNEQLVRQKEGWERKYQKASDKFRSVNKELNEARDKIDTLEESQKILQLELKMSFSVKRARNEQALSLLPPPSIDPPPSPPSSDDPPPPSSDHQEGVTSARKKPSPKPKSQRKRPAPQLKAPPSKSVSPIQLREEAAVIGSPKVVLGPPAQGSETKRRRKRVNWTDEEVESLIRAHTSIDKCHSKPDGMMFWETILKIGLKFHSARTAEDLKEKWKRLRYYEDKWQQQHAHLGFVRGLRDPRR